MSTFELEEPLEVKTRTESGDGDFKKPSFFIPKKLLAKSVDFDAVKEKKPKTPSSQEESQESIKKEELQEVDNKSQVETNTEATSQQQPSLSIPYDEPDWSGPCSQPYSFEVLKNGVVIDTVDLTTRPYHVFGRLPSCHVTLEHPSLSRHHAIVQYSAVEGHERYPKGWYLYDLESTHGTMVNKRRLKGRHYMRLYVGHVIKFGGSTRLHVLSGPEEDREPELELSWSELKKQKEQSEAEVEVLRRDREEREAALARTMGDTACSWGMSDDAIEVTQENPFSEVDATEHEASYRDDPKRALRQWCEREGHEQPQYEFLEAGFGKHQCRIELPLDGDDGRPLVAEAITSGKKKEAVLSCAHEACRLLDRIGELHKSGTSRASRDRQRQARLEENEYYSSDEDIFLDRTGQIEQKRQIRMRRAGKVVDKPETFVSLTTKLEDVVQEMASIEAELEKARQELAAKQTSSELDELEAYMSAIKSGTMDRSSRMRLKTRLIELRREEARLRKMANIAKPAELRIPKTPTTEKSFDPASSKAAVKSSLMKIKLDPIHKVFHERAPQVDDGVESDEEEENAVKEIDHGTSSNDADKQPITDAHVTSSNDADKQLITVARVTSSNDADKQPITVARVTSSNDADKQPITDTHKTSSNDSAKEIINSDQINVPQKSSKILPNSSPSVKGPQLQPLVDGTVDEDAKVSQPVSHSKTSSTPVVKGPQLPPNWTPQHESLDQGGNSVTPETTSVDVKRKHQLKSGGSAKKQQKMDTEYDATDPDFAVWIPPENQSGDGKTKLNDKYGY